MSVLRRRLLTLLAVAVVVGGACSSDEEGRASEAADGQDRTSGTSPPPVDAVLLPAEGPLQAGTYAVPGFIPLLSLELQDGWTVIGRAEGAVTLAYRFDPEGRELARLNLAEVSGAFDSPFIGPETMQQPAMQQARLRPLPSGGLEATLAALPGVEVSGRTRVEVAGVERTRFTARVGDLPAEAKEKCPQIPTGCVVAYDLPGAMAAIFPGGTAHDLTTFEVDGATYLAAVAAPSAGPPAGFEAAADAVIRSLSLDRPIELDPQASLALFADAIADPKLRPLGRSVTAPGSPASTFMAALDDDRLAQQLAGNTLPVRQADVAADRFTISGGPGSEEYDTFTFEGGRVAAFQVQGQPIADFVRAIAGASPLRIGPLQVTPLEVYRSFVSGRLWVPVRVVNGAEAVKLDGLIITHVAPDGTSRPSAPISDLEVAAHWDAPFTLLFDDAPLGGKLVFGGTIEGEPVDAAFELPAAKTT